MILIIPELGPFGEGDGWGNVERIDIMSKGIVIQIYFLNIFYFV